MWFWSPEIVWSSWNIHPNQWRKRTCQFWRQCLGCYPCSIERAPRQWGIKGQKQKIHCGCTGIYLKPIWIGLFFFWAHFSHFSFKPNTYKHFFNIPKHSKSLKAIFYHLSFHPCHGGAQQVDIQCSSGNIGPLPTKYLDLSLEEKYKSLSIWNEVLEKMEKKLTNGKLQYLSLGGRITMINGVLSALPT